MLTGFGFLLLVVGGLGLLGWFMQKKRGGRLLDTPFAPTGQVAAQGRAIASPKGGISTYGQMQTQNVLTSPVSGAPCVYYQMRVEAEWGEKGKEAKHTVVEQKEAVPFAVNDGSGAAVVWIDAKRGGEFSSAKPFTRKKFSRGLMATMTSKPLEVTPHFAIPPAVQVPGPFGRPIDVPVTASFFVTEEFLEAKSTGLYVNGKLNDDGSIGSPSWISLLVQDKTREELAGAAAKTAQRAMIVGAAATPLGAILTIVGFILGPKHVAAAMPPTTQAAMIPQTSPIVPAPTVAPSLATSALTLTGDCSTAGFALSGNMMRVMNAGDGLNVTAVNGTSLSRVFVHFGAAPAPGAAVPVCTIGRRCTQNIQIGVGTTTYLNLGRGVGGNITATAFDLATGQTSLSFDNVTLKQSNGAASCTINGTLQTSGLST